RHPALQVDVAGGIDPLVQGEAAVVRPPAKEVEPGRAVGPHVRVDVDQAAGRVLRPDPEAAVEAPELGPPVLDVGALVQPDRVIRRPVRERPAERVVRADAHESRRGAPDYVERAARRTAERSAAYPRLPVPAPELRRGDAELPAAPPLVEAADGIRLARRRDQTHVDAHPVWRRLRGDANADRLLEDAVARDAGNR